MFCLRQLKSDIVCLLYFMSVFICLHCLRFSCGHFYWINVQNCSPLFTLWYATFIGKHFYIYVIFLHNAFLHSFLIHPTSFWNWSCYGKCILVFTFAAFFFFLFLKSLLYLYISGFLVLSSWGEVSSFSLSWSFIDFGNFYRNILGQMRR